MRDRYVEREAVDRIRFRAAALEHLRAGDIPVQAKTRAVSLKGIEKRAISLSGADRLPVALFKDSFKCAPTTSQRIEFPLYIRARYGNCRRSCR